MTTTSSLGQLAKVMKVQNSNGQFHGYVELMENHSSSMTNHIDCISPHHHQPPTTTPLPHQKKRKKKKEV